MKFIKLKVETAQVETLVLGSLSKEYKIWRTCGIVQLGYLACEVMTKERSVIEG